MKKEKHGGEEASNFRPRWS